MKRIEFTSKTAQRIYDSYIKRAGKATKILSADDRKDLLLEINSHIFEALERKGSGDESETLLNTLEALGEPSDYLAPMVAEKKLKQATRTFNPLHVLQALILNVRNGVAYLLVGFLYLLLFVFVFLFFAKIASPDTVGMFFDDQGYFQVLGWANDTSNLHEKMGYWLLPFLVVATIVLYVINTLILRWVSK